MKIVGMLPVYNEEDIVGQVVAHLIKQGIRLVILDNGSSDGSYGVCSSFLGKGVLHIEQIHTRAFRYQWLLKRLYSVALRYRPDWALITAADEFLESPYRGLTLAKAIELEAEHGYNVIQFNKFEFWPTEKDYWNPAKDVRKRMRYYTWDANYQFRAFKVSPGVTIHEGSGHYPIFPYSAPYKVAPTKFVLRHYGIRSYEQGMKKIFRDRLPRYDPEETRRGWHIHYDFVAKDPRRMVAESSALTRYVEGDSWNLHKTFDSTGGVSSNLGYYLTRLVRPSFYPRDLSSLAIDVARRRYIDRWGGREDKMSRLVRRVIFGDWVRRFLFDAKE